MMGSFNVKCMISSQQIGWKDEVVYFPLRRHFESYGKTEVLVDGERVCVQQDKSAIHAAAFYNLVTDYYFTGKYDDYGRFEMHDTVRNRNNVENFLTYISKTSVETIQGENKYHDLAWDPKTITDDNKTIEFFEEEFWELVHKNRIFIRDKNSRLPTTSSIVNLRFGVVLKSVFDHMVNADWVAKKKDKFYEINGQSFIDATRIFRLNDVYPDHTKSHSEIQKFLKYDQEEMKYIIDCDDENLSETLDHYIGFSLFISAMNHMDMALTPMMYGSQVDDGAIMFAEIVAKACEVQRNKYNEED